ncbi:MAG: hypothetical protein WCX46_04470, partial [Candidatus Paceibacterota bacterium]
MENNYKKLNELSFEEQAKVRKIFLDAGQNIEDFYSTEELIKSEGFIKFEESISLLAAELELKVIEDNKKRNLCLNKKVIACISSNFKRDDYTEKVIKFIRENGTYVNFDRAEKGYIISEIDDQDKYSEGYKDCTGIIVVGRNK